MRQIWLFFQNYSSVLLFIVLEIFAFAFLFSRTNYQKAKFLNSNSVLQSKVNEQRHKITSYFQLQEVNNDLANENKLLQEKVQRLTKEQYPIQDSIKVDSTKRVEYNFKVAKVISNPLNTTFNHITINKGSADGVKVQDGILSPNGVVGKVVNVTEHYSLIMPLFNPNSKLNVKHKVSGYNGNLIWQGKNFQTVKAENISRSATVNLQDTLITNQYSKSFPEGSKVGVVENITFEPSGNFYLLDIKPLTEFNRLDFVYVVQRSDLPEILELENSIP